MATETRSKSALIVGLFALAIALGSPEENSLFAREPSASKPAGKIAGKVRLEGGFRKAAPFRVFKNREFCGSEVPDESLLAGPDGGVRNAVVVIAGIQNPKAQAGLRNFALDNRNCAFVPHVQVVPVGSEILLLNNDPILHDAHARMGRETLFNVGLPSWRQVKKRLSREGIVRIECDVLHTWQSAYIVVTSSPYSAVTGKSGEFVFEQVPAGRYDLEFWHEKLGKQRRRILVEEGRTSKIEAVFSCAFCETL